VEVGPRDGLQNESVFIPTEMKFKFIENLIKAGHKNLEVTSFVSPKAIAQMKDSLNLYELVNKRIKDESLNLSVFIANEKGAENALKFGVKEISVFTTTSETFAEKNVRSTISGTIERIQNIKKVSSKFKIRGYISTVFGCPFEKKYSDDKTLELIEKLLSLGCYEVALGDTIGVASPAHVKRLMEKIIQNFDSNQIAMHFHDTRGLAVANVYQSLESGVRTFDASAGGLGGCPYALGASGNIATEDLCAILEAQGFEHGINLEKLEQASREIFETVKKKSNSKMNQFIYKPGGSCGA